LASLQSLELYIESSACFSCFHKYCCSGSVCNLSLKTFYQVGYGIINLYTTRFIKEIYNIQSQLASWPTQEEKVELSQVMKEEGFPGCIGFVDGTKIPLTQKPPIDGNHYRSGVTNASVISNSEGIWGGAGTGRVAGGEAELWVRFVIRPTQRTRERGIWLDQAHKGMFEDED
ncbi:uncharacterized protein VP01_5692g1, partial [Puccinia sorghi]